MPPGSTITIRPGGRLILGPTARLHNACGKIWEGIVVERMGRQTGQIVLEGNPVVEQVRNPIPEPPKS